MHCLRAIRGVTRTDSLQDIKMRKDTVTTESITDVIRHRRLRWFGQGCSMPRKNTLLGKYTNKTSKDRGRQKGHRRQRTEEDRKDTEDKGQRKTERTQKTKDRGRQKGHRRGGDVE